MAEVGEAVVWAIIEDETVHKAADINQVI
jgi:hypothetical protein